ncbi:hypothetical protein [Mycolicibacterium sphagni]|uniref:Uncharacterized protein n=1 Tax=Mycolicibacterium sphagni TaxID=1786 RepID=A0ABX2JYC1_9MYCO|nr:hypothetical protein [Mycolicibacterium sphagni]NTY61819.1 hypothetical protein [Mycolicibacterium sphagni]
MTVTDDAGAEIRDDGAFVDERWDLPLPDDESLPSRAPRAAARGPRDGAGDLDGPAEADDACGPEPVESEETPVSANAAGIAATAEPTPSATASAPT